MKKITIGDGLTVLSLGVLGCCCALMDTIPPRNLTDTRLWVTKRRIIQYAKTHGALPSSLTELPAMPGYDTETVDDWGRPLDYSVNGSLVTLRSLGSDKQTGGIGDAADMVGEFTARDTAGNWVGEIDGWTRNPMKP